LFKSSSKPISKLIFTEVLHTFSVVFV